MMSRAAILITVFGLGFPGLTSAVYAEEPPATEKSDAAGAEKDAAAKRVAEEYELQKLFADTLDQVERNYVKNISRRELMEAAIHGVLSKLDQYSNYISPEDLGQFKTSVENQFGGIGIQVDLTRDGRIVVISPIVGSPAYRAGMQAGDQIVAIEGKPTDDLRTIQDVIDKLKGEPGTKVTITTRRPSTGERRTFSLERELVHLETVMGDQRKADDSWDFMLDHDRKIGYIRITSFSRDTEQDLTKALDELKRENVRGLILDLRFNPGGLLTSAIAVADLFVTKGKIVSTEGRNTKSRSWDAQESGTYEGFPMAVLVNRYSASASEIVSACLQDHHRAIVIGERTWGKGSVQNVIELEGGKSALKLTTASYQRPSGKNIHRFPDASEADEWGVKPDAGYDLKLDDGELLGLMTYRHDRDILLVNHYQDKARREAAATNEETKADAPPSDADKPSGDKPIADKPSPDKPATRAKPDGDDAADEKPAADKPAAEKSGGKKPSFTDRQLQKAIDYLSGELAKAN
ncbi:MAG TPA: S41 family peptidase [Pirellulales bacterium]|nr:S41 family peptidase [Pirellulales bacterium]